MKADVMLLCIEAAFRRRVKHNGGNAAAILTNCWSIMLRDHDLCRVLND
jgi:hypothetical protein